MITILILPQISDNERIVVYAPDYFRNLTKLIEKYNRTENDQK